MVAKPVPFQFGGLFNSIDQTKIGEGRCYTMSNASVDRGVLESRSGYNFLCKASTATAADVGYGCYYCNFEQNTVYRFTTTNTATGTVRFTVENIFGIQETVDINVQQLTSNQLRDKLLLLSNMKTGDVDVSGGTHPGATSQITFKGRLAGTSVTMTLNSSGLTAGSATLTRVTEGGAYEEVIWVVDIGGEGGTNASLWRYNVQTQTVTGPIYEGMIADDWYFQQYADKVYMVSKHNAMLVYTIGGGVQNFDPPPAPPPFSTGNHCERLDSNPVPNFQEWTVGNLQGMSTGATIAFENQNTGTSIKITNGGTIISAGTLISFDLTPNSAKNFGHNDAFSIITNANFDDVECMPDLDNASFRFTTSNGNVDPDDNWVWSFVNTGSGADPIIVSVMYHFKDATLGGYTRDKRRAVTKITCKILVGHWGANKYAHIRFVAGRTWMLDTRSFQSAPPAWDLHPKNFKVTDESTENYPTYACAFYNSVTGLESALGDTFTPEPQPPQFSPYHGRWYRIPIGTIPDPGPEVADMIRIYRKEKSTSKWRRIRNPLAAEGDIDDTFSVGPQGDYYIIDSWMEHEIADFDEPEGGGDGGGTISLLSRNAEQIGVWRQSLVIASRKRIYFSYVGRPEDYIQESDNYPDKISSQDIDNIARGRNVYLSDTRSEDCKGIIGLDSLYLPGARGNYAVTGNLPADASPPRHLPGSRGVLSYRGSKPYGGGCELIAADGIWFYGVGRGFKGEDDGSMIQREETLNIRESFKNFHGSDASESILAVYGSDEFWAINGRKYIHFSRNKIFEEGSFNDSFVDACSVFGYGIVAQIDNGKIMLFADTATSDNGADIAWMYETGIQFEPRRKVTKIEWFGDGNPSVQIFTNDGESTETYSASNSATFTLDTSRKGVIPFVVQPGVRYKFVFRGASHADRVRSFVIYYEQVGPADGG